MPIMAVRRPGARRDVDSGWAWIVMVATALNIASSGMVYYGVGVMQVILPPVFEDAALGVTWVLGINTSLLTLSGPLFSLISNELGCRAAMLVGAVLQLVGVLSSAFVTDLSHLYVTLGCIAGLGSGFTDTGSHVILGFYFNKHLTLALGVTCAGAGLALLIAASFVNFVETIYGWRGMFMMIAGVSAQCLVCSSLCRLNSLELKIISERKRKRKEPRPHGVVEEAMLPHRELAPKSDDASNADVQLSPNDNILHRRSVSTNSLEMKKISLEQSASAAEISWLRQAICDVWDLCSLPAVLFYSSILSWSLSVSAIFIHLQSYVVSRGLSMVEAALLTTSMGVCNMITRPLVGALLGCGVMDQRVMYVCSFAVIGVTSLVFPFLPVSFPLSMVFSGLIGLCLAGPYVVITSIAKELVGLRHLAVGYGLYALTCGVGQLIGAPIAGAMLRASGVYTWSFVFIGVTALLSAILGVFMIRCRMPLVEVVVLDEPVDGV